MNSLRIALGAPGVGRAANGVGTAVIGQARELFEAGHEVTLISSDGPGAHGLPRPRDNGAGRLSVQLFPIASLWDRRLYRAPALRPWLETHIDEFDVVDIHGVWSLFVVDLAAACRKHAVPYLLTPHGQTTEWDWGRGSTKKSLFFSLMMRRMWQSAAAIRFVSHDESAHSVIEANGRGIVIPNFVPPADPDLAIDSLPLKRRFNIPEEAIVVLFLGRIDPQKGILELLDAFDRVWQQRNNLVLMIVGPADDAVYGKAVAERCASLSCSRAVRLTGPLYGQEKEAAFACASVFATVSKAEGLPIAVLEAMSRGVAALLTPESNLPQVKEYEAGAIASSDEPRAVADSLLQMISDLDRLRRMGRNAQQLVANNFRNDVIVPKLISLYERVACRRSRRPHASTAARL